MLIKCVFFILIYALIVNAEIRLDDDPRINHLFNQYLKYYDCSNNEKDCYSHLRSKLELKQAKKKYATEGMISPWPFYKEHFPGGEWLEEEKKFSVEHAFDEAGKILWIDTHMTHLFFYSDSFVEELLFNCFGKLQLVRHYYYEDNKIQRMLTFFSYQGTDTFYKWENGLLKKAVSRSWKNEKILFPNRPWENSISEEFYYQYRYEYVNKNLSTIKQDYLKNNKVISTELIYDADIKSIDLNEFINEVQRKLIISVKKSLEKYKLANEPTAIFITYCSSGWDLTPTLEICNESPVAGISLLDCSSQSILLECQELKDLWARLYLLASSKDEYELYRQILYNVSNVLNNNKSYIFDSNIKNTFFSAGDSSDGFNLIEDIKRSRSGTVIECIFLFIGLKKD